MAEAVSWDQQSPPESGQAQQPASHQSFVEQDGQAEESVAAGQQLQQQVPDSTPATRQQHAGTKGELAVQIKNEDNMPQDLLHSTGAAASDVAQDTSVAAAPAAALPSSVPIAPASTAAPSSMPFAGGQQLDASSPSSGDNDSTPGPARGQLATAAADAAGPAVAEAAVLAPPLQQQAQPDDQQQQQSHAAAAAMLAGQPEALGMYRSGAAAAADQQAVQEQQQQQQQQVPQYSLGLELLGEAADLLPQDGPVSFVAAAAAAAAAAMHSQSQHHLQHQHQHHHHSQALYMPGAAAAAAAARPRGTSASGRKDGSGRQARASLNQLMYEGSGYGEPSLPIITKPDGVACQVRVA
jgi:hypothetical protein